MRLSSQHKTNLTSTEKIFSLTQNIKSLPVVEAGLALAPEVEGLLQPVSPPGPGDLTEVHAVDVGHLLPGPHRPAGHQVVDPAHVEPYRVGGAGVIEEAADDRIDSAACRLSS